MRQAARRGSAALALALLPSLSACGGTVASTVSTGTSTASTATGTASTATGTASTATGTASTATGTASTATGTASTGAGTASTASACGTGLQITVKGSSVTPAPGITDVKAGCQVDLTITADRTSEVHVHVVELEKAITAGQPLHVTFTPTQPGVYEVELHDPDLLLVKLAVR